MIFRWCCISALLLLTACTQGQLPLWQQVRPFPEENICRVAVLPFTNESGYESGGSVLHRIFTAELVGIADYYLVQEGEVRKTYRHLSIYPGREPSFDELQSLARKLDVQMIVQATVLEMTDGRQNGSQGTPLLAAVFRIRTAPSCDTLWTTYHRREGSEYRTVMHFGCINTMSGLARQVAAEVLQVWKEKGIPSCNS